MKNFKNLKIAGPTKKKKLLSLQQIVSEAKRYHEKFFWDDPNIVAIGVGFKVSGSNKNFVRDSKGDEMVCIKFSVTEKIAPERFMAESIKRTKLLPKFLQFNGHSIPTDIEERDYKLHYRLVDGSEVKPQTLNERKVRLNTVQPGVSISNTKGTAGTLGAIVYDNKTYQPYALSNWHVMAGADSQPGDTIVQPGPYDDDRIQNNVFGKLVRSHIGMSGDCAISSIENRGFQESIYGLNATPYKVADVDLGDKLIKSGRTTDVTRGVVSQVNMTTRMSYDGLNEPAVISSFEIVPIKDAGRTYEISAGGDSGSLWLIDDKAKGIAVGLHFGGEASENDREFALACYLNKVLQKLEVHIPSTQPGMVVEKISAGNGFSESFLKPQVKLPSTKSIPDVLVVRKSPVIKYHNFSIVMSKTRKLAIFTAANIDGSKMNINNSANIPRPSWKTDGNVGKDNQTTDDNFYKKIPSKFDRGHMVRRFDPMWGRNPVQAHNDTFYFTNVVPQAHSFNAGLWNDLEDWVLYDADTKNRQVNIFTGPIFMSTDKTVEGIKVPYFFWKVIVRYKTSAKRLVAIGFIMGSGKEEIASEEVAAEAKRINPIPDGKVVPYQVPIKLIESYTRLDFQGLSKFDLTEASSFTAESIDQVKPITQKQDIHM